MDRARRVGAVAGVDGRGHDALARAVDLIGLGRDRDRRARSGRANPVGRGHHDRIAEWRTARAVDQHRAEKRLAVTLRSRGAGAEQKQQTERARHEAIMEAPS